MLNTLKQILTESFKMTHIITKLIIMTQSWVDLTNMTSKIHFAPNWRTSYRVKMTFSQWVKYRWVVLTCRVGARWHANLWYCWLWIILTQNVNFDPFLFWPASPFWPRYRGRACEIKHVIKKWRLHRFNKMLVGISMWICL